MNLPDRKELSFDDHLEGSLDDHFSTRNIRNSVSCIFFSFFFNPIQPFLLPRISTQREKSGLISRTFVQFNLNSNIELFFFFFFYPLFSPEPNNRFVYEKKKKKRNVFRFSPQRIFRVEQSHASVFLDHSPTLPPLSIFT